MGALTDDIVVASRDGQGLGIPTTPTVLAANTIYRGAVVASNAGSAIPSAGASQLIYGIAQEYGAAGKAVQVLRGQQIEITVGGSPAIDAVVYTATDNPNDATTVSTGATRIGFITEKSTSDTSKWWVLVAPTA